MCCNFGIEYLNLIQNTIVSMKVHELFRFCVEFLRSRGVETPKTDTELIFSHFLKISRVEIYTGRDSEIPRREYKKIMKAIFRRSQQEPTEYIIGYKYFWGNKFEIRKGVLIPRFDTESLIYQAKKLCNRPKYILDIGTGAGIIGITLKTIFKDSYVVLVDISDDILNLAERNAKNILGELRDVELVKADVYEGIWEKIGWGKFDLIISNPPYISRDDFLNLPSSVKAEPHEALYGGVSGNNFFLKIADKIDKFLSRKGKVILEVGDELQAEKVKQIFRWKGFRNFITFRDMNGKVRGVVIFNF